MAEAEMSHDSLVVTDQRLAARGGLKKCAADIKNPADVVHYLDKGLPASEGFLLSTFGAHDTILRSKLVSTPGACADELSS